MHDNDASGHFGFGGCFAADILMLQSPRHAQAELCKTSSNDLSFVTLECLVVLEEKTRVCDSVTAGTDVLLLPQFAFEFEELVRNLAILESYKKSKRSPIK